MTLFWLIAWALALSLGWLLPNHYMPWSTYHIEVWMAGIVLLAGTAVIVRSDGDVRWYGIAVLAAMLAVLPVLQFGLGLVSFAGTAWISTAYLGGFVFALLIGAMWERTTPWQLADGLFLSLGVAAIASVGLQLYQWLQLGSPDDIWIIKNSTGRPYGNLAQPNELGTLLVWGLLATAWGYFRRQLGAASSLFIALYLLFGMSLTQSRTGWLAIAILVGASWLWRKHWQSRRLPCCVTSLGLYFVVCVLSLTGLAQALLLFTPTDLQDFERLSSGKRPLIWAIMLDAALQQPLFGYGWNQIIQAQLSVAPAHPALNEVTLHSHNLFLDFMLWCGIPLGLFISFCTARWLWIRVRAVQCAEDALLVLVVLVVCNHAMLELPLHHAFFLLPLGLFMGVIDARFGQKPVVTMRRGSIAIIGLVVAALLGLIVRDYARLEESYLGLRLENAHVHTETKAGVPDMVLLNQWAEYIRMARVEPVQGMGSEQLNLMRKVVSTFAQTGQTVTLAKALALNNQPEEAQLWLRRLCKVEDAELCSAFKREWVNQDVQKLAPWPE